MHAATHAAPPRLRVAREGAGAICAVPRSRKDRELTVIRSHARPGAWVITLAVLAVGAFVSAPTASAVVSHTVAGSTAKAKRIQQFWTPKRMRQAKPLPLPRAAPPSPSSSRSDSSAAPTGKPRTIPPSLPKGDSGSASPRAAIVQNPAAYPYSTQGKLFGKDRNGTFSCSATVVTTPSNRVVFTAGHCARENGVWASKETFVPAYKNGHAPYGSFAASSWYVPNQWFDREDESYDFSAMVLYRQVANVVGARGIAWNYPANQRYISYGYPASYPFNGENPYSCPSYLGGRDPWTSYPQTMWITCNMTAGSSGGGWIMQNEYLNSVNSYGYRGQPNRMYGPYLGNVFGDFYNWVTNKGS